MHEVELHAFRHAESVGNINSHIIGGRSDHFELSPTGPAQARALGKFTLERGIVPDVVVSSPAIRAYQTGQIVINTMRLDHLPITILEPLHELDQGEHTGRVREEIWTPQLITQAEAEGKEFRAPGGESQNSAGLQFETTIDEFIAEHELPSNRPLVVFAFTHGYRIRCFASRQHDWSYDQTRNGKLVPNASDNIFQRHSGRWQLKALGVTPDQPYGTLLL
jgi:broad specificity phosphatase PhoE